MTKTEYKVDDLPRSLDDERGSVSGAGRKGKPLREMFDVDDVTGCWVWRTPTDGGYGRLTIKGRLLYAHRVVYVMLRGPVDPELDLDHLCRNRACVNPDHVEPVAPRINVLRGVAAKESRTRCSRGHELTEDNVITYASRVRGWRSCRSCRNEWQRECRAGQSA